MGEDHVNQFQLLYSDVKKVNLRRPFIVELYPFPERDPFIEEKRKEFKRR